MNTCMYSKTFFSDPCLQQPLVSSDISSLPKVVSSYLNLSSMTTQNSELRTQHLFIWPF